MYKLVIFAVFMLLMSAICNGQGKVPFGASRAQDTSYTNAQVKLNAYSGGADTVVPVVLPNGDVKTVLLSSIGGSVDTTEFLRWQDTLSVLATKGDLANIGGAGIPRYAGGTLIYNDTATQQVNNVVLLVGQSNALGQFADTALKYLPTEYTDTADKIKIWWTGDHDSPVPGHFEDMLVPINTRDSIYTDPADIPNYYITGWGVEQSAARRLQAVFNDTLYVIKSARGGRAIRFWSKDANGFMWQQLSQYITESLDSLDAKGVPANFRALVWMQGESDCLEGLTATYEDSLRIVINNVRAIDPRLDSMLWVNVKLRAGMIPQGQVDVINAAFDQMSDESAFNVTVDPVQVGATLFDGLHYGKSMIKLGNAIADTILKYTTHPPEYVSIAQGTVNEINVNASTGFNFRVIPSLAAPTLSLSTISGYTLLNPASSGTGTTVSGNVINADISTGKGGGQTIYGGNTNTDDLIIQSTNSTLGTTSYIHNLGGGFTWGLAAFTPTLEMQYQRNLNASTGFRIQNQNTGNNARAVMDFENDGAFVSRFSKAGTGFVTSGIIKANDLTIGNSGAGDINIANGVAAGAVQFAAGARTVADLLVVASTGNINLTNKLGSYAGAAPSNGQILVGDGTDFEKATITAGSGISVTNGAGSITIANTRVDSSKYYSGWGDYTDGVYTSGSPLVLTSGVKRTLYNHATTIRHQQKPVDVDSFYSRTDSTITGRNGDGLNVLIEFSVRPTTASVTKITVTLDIGGAVGEIYPRDFILTKGSGVEHFYLSSFAAYTLDTWAANGAKVKVVSDAGAEIYNLRYILTRTHKAR